MNKTINIDGFEIDSDLWENELKLTYISSKPKELEAVYDISKIIKNAIGDIERYLTSDDYTPGSSPKELKLMSENFMNNDITHAVLEDDEIAIERMIEMINGVNTRTKQIVVSTIISCALRECYNIEDTLSH